MATLSNFRQQTKNKNPWYQQIVVVAKDIASGAGNYGSISGPVKSDAMSPAARHRCDVSSELYCL